MVDLKKFLRPKKYNTNGIKFSILESITPYTLNRDYPDFILWQDVLERFLDTEKGCLVGTLLSLDISDGAKSFYLKLAAFASTEECYKTLSKIQGASDLNFADANTQIIDIVKKIHAIINNKKARGGMLEIFFNVAPKETHKEIFKHLRYDKQDNPIYPAPEKVQHAARYLIRKAVIKLKNNNLQNLKKYSKEQHELIKFLESVSAKEFWVAHYSDIPNRELFKIFPRSFLIRSSIEQQERITLRALYLVSETLKKIYLSEDMRVVGDTNKQKKLIEISYVIFLTLSEFGFDEDTILLLLTKIKKAFTKIYEELESDTELQSSKFIQKFIIEISPESFVEVLDGVLDKSKREWLYPELLQPAKKLKVS